jgi:hypothetical protein
MNDKIEMSDEKFTIIRIHFKDGTFEDNKFYYSSNPGCGYNHDRQLREWRDEGYICAKGGKVPFHDVTLITNNYCKTIKCPCCDRIGYVMPDKID